MFLPVYDSSSSACYRQAGLICDFLDSHVSRFQGSSLLCNLSFLREPRKVDIPLVQLLIVNVEMTISMFFLHGSSMYLFALAQLKTQQWP